MQLKNSADRVTPRWHERHLSGRLVYRGPSWKLVNRIEVLHSVPSVTFSSTFTAPSCGRRWSGHWKTEIRSGLCSQWRWQNQLPWDRDKSQGVFRNCTYIGRAGTEWARQTQQGPWNETLCVMLTIWALNGNPLKEVRQSDGYFWKTTQTACCMENELGGHGGEGCGR